MNLPLTSTLLALPLADALRVIGSFNTLDHLPDSIWEPVQDLADAALACFPETQASFWDLMDAQRSDPTSENTFNYIADAHRLLVAAVEGATFPLTAKNGSEDVIMDEDTPLAVMLPQAQTMEVLQSAAESGTGAYSDAEFSAVFRMTKSLLDRHPAAGKAVHAAMEADLQCNFFAAALQNLTSGPEMTHTVSILTEMPSPAKGRRLAIAA